MTTRIPHAICVLLGLALLEVVLGGCVEPPAPSSSSDGTTGTTTHDPGTTTSTTGADESSGALGDSSSDDGNGDGPWCSAAEGEWYCPPDGGGVAFECDMVAQDCPEGEKCLPWANDGGRAWNATRCGRVDLEADVAGQPCTVTGSALSGIDSCEVGSMCWNVDPVTLEGECVPTCIAAGEQLVCDDPDARCMVANEGAIVLCLPECDPLGSDCDSDEVCVPEPSEQFWTCAPALTVPGEHGDPCEFLNPCAAGLACTSPLAVPPELSCVGTVGCCTPLCELGGEPSCPAGTECAAWYLAGEAPLGLDTLGLCSVEPDVPRGGWSTSYIEHLIADLGR